jgi:hypothetical protein
MSGSKGNVMMKVAGQERRSHRRHDLESLGVKIDRWDPARQTGAKFGRIVDLSAGGVKILAKAGEVKADSQIRVRMELPTFAGISPFVDTTGPQIQPKREWVGWLSVTRLHQSGKEVEIAGRLVDMAEMDRGMLGLYLSTQPLAA